MAFRSDSGRRSAATCSTRPYSVNAAHGLSERAPPALLFSLLCQEKTVKGPVFAAEILALWYGRQRNNSGGRTAENSEEQRDNSKSLGHKRVRGSQLRNTTVVESAASKIECFVISMSIIKIHLPVDEDGIIQELFHRVSSQNWTTLASKSGAVVAVNLSPVHASAADKILRVRFLNLCGRDMSRHDDQHR
jgi:hypothetical protein